MKPVCANCGADPDPGAEEKLCRRCAEALAERDAHVGPKFAEAERNASRLDPKWRKKARKSA